MLLFLADSMGNSSQFSVLNFNYVLIKAIKNPDAFNNIGIIRCPGLESNQHILANGRF